MDSIKRIKNFIRSNFPEWEKVEFTTFDDTIDFRTDWNDLYRISDDEIILVAYTNISITGTDRSKPQLRVFLDEYKKSFYFAKKHNLRFYLFSIFTKEDDMARGLDNFNPKDYIISIETNFDNEGSRRDLRSIYDYANEKLNGRKFLKCSREHYKADINQASFIYIGTPDSPEKEIFENFINIFDSRPYLNSKIDTGSCTEIQTISLSSEIHSTYLPYLTALRTKPFMLLAGISGTGKSRIARQIAKACWTADSEERTKQVPSNFCMIQVKPNWHDSTELLGYVSRIEGEKYIAGKFLPFVAKAWENLDVPHILCLDEMNLAPVEQYFAEYLSVIESRKLNDDGTITTDPIITAVAEQWFWDLVQTLTSDGALQEQFKKKGITLPPNLFVIGTVNIDETTFSFSRKVLDRAMTIEMNEVDLEGGLTKEEQNELGEIGNSIIGLAVEGKDIYEDHKDYCDQVIEYLKLVNEELENTPFKIAYRTRNEFLLYAVNRKTFDNESSLETALDEMTSMKILPRVEGDSERVKTPLEALSKLMQERGWDENESISLKKIKEMLTKLQQSGYTSYWT
jgi:hypothetical protein